MCNCFLSCWTHYYFRLILCILISFEFLIKSISCLGWFPDNKSVIYFLDTIVLKKIQEHFECLFFFCYKDSSTRVSINSVYECWPERKAVISASKHILYQLYQRYFSSLVVSWVHIHSRWLINNEEIFIFIENFQMNFIRDGDIFFFFLL